MLPRFCALYGLVLASALACGPVYTEVDFEPLSEAGATGAKQSAAGIGGSSGAVDAAGAGSAAGSAAAPAGAGGALEIPGPAAAGTSNGAGGRGAGGTGAGGTSGEAGSGGNASTAASGCALLGTWQEQAYTLGERVVSTCKVPYNGACPANETRQFECQPPTGAVGLGWCRDRQPGVINGWHEAWVMRDACPAL